MSLNKFLICRKFDDCPWRGEKHTCCDVKFSGVLQNGGEKGIVKVGNMFEEVEKTKNFIGGQCPHHCSYCYVNSLKKRYPLINQRYSGKLRLLESEFKKPLGNEKTIFVQDCGDLFASEIPREWILKVLHYCKQYPHKEFYFLTKNPERYKEFLPYFYAFNGAFLGATVETDNDTNYKEFSEAPLPRERILAMTSLNHPRKFISIEPIMDGYFGGFASLLEEIKPSFIYVGADSKGHSLPEPSAEKTRALITELQKFTEVRVKKNLNRILKEDCYE